MTTDANGITRYGPVCTDPDTQAVTRRVREYEWKVACGWTVGPSGYLEPPATPRKEQTREVRVDPDPRDLLSELLRALGEFDGARPETPQALWNSSIAKVRGLMHIVHPERHGCGPGCPMVAVKAHADWSE